MARLSPFPLFFNCFLRKDLRDLGTLPSMQAAAAATASAVSAKGSKWMRLTYFLALEASAKNLSWRSSSDVLESFLSSVILNREYPAGVSKRRCIVVVVVVVDDYSNRVTDQLYSYFLPEPTLEQLLVIPTRKIDGWIGGRGKKTSRCRARC
mmetsp:Transcript_26449/g.55510  ORF Transcript_26449/g.55510 Transcript_26449/m.55510 type:complete len:152 (+) Transcript_26449:148-603(+)